MAKRQFKKFTAWYLRTLNPRELLTAYRTISGKLDIAREESCSLEEMRQRLEMGWQRKGMGIAISEYFLEKTESAITAVNERQRPQIRSDLQELLTIYGLRDLVFALVVGQDEYTNEIGYQLMQEKGQQLIISDETLREGEEAIKELQLEKNITKDGGKERANSLINELIDILEAGAKVNIAGFNEGMERLQATWDTYQRNNQRVFSEELDALLSLSKKDLALGLCYFEVEELVPLKKEAYLDIAVSEYDLVKNSLGELGRLCSNWVELKDEPHSTLGETRDWQRRVEALGEKIITAGKVINNALARPREKERTEKKASDIPDEDGEKGIKDITEKEGRSVGVSGDTAPGHKGPAPEPIPSELALQGGEGVESDIAPQGESTSPSTLAEKFDGAPAECKPGKQIAQEDAGPDGELVGPLPIAFTACDKEVIRALERCDPATIYWLTREQMDNPAGEETPLLPLWLSLAAVLGVEASWLGLEEKELLRDLCLDHEDPLGELLQLMPVSEESLVLFLSAISLAPALFAPETGAGTWLAKAKELIRNPEDPLGKLLDNITKFSSYGRPLNRAVLQQTAAGVNWEGEAQSISGELEQALKRLSSARISYVPANEAFRYLVSPQGPLWEALTVVRENKVQHSVVVGNVLANQLRDRRNMISLIVGATKAMKGSRPRAPRIHSNPLEQIIRRLEELKGYLRKWLQAVEIGGLQDCDNDWWVRQTQGLRDEFLAGWQQLEKALQETEVGETAGDQVGYLQVEKGMQVFAYRVFSRFADRFRPEEGGGVNSDKEESPCWRVALQRPLLLLTGTSLREGQDLDIKESFLPTDSLIRALIEGRNLMDAFELHLRQYDLFMADAVVQELRGRGKMEADELERRLDAETNRVKAYAKSVIESTYDAIEQATIDHVLSEEQRSQMTGDILSLEEKNTKQINILLAELDGINKELKQLRLERQESLREIIEELRLYMQQDDDVATNYTPQVVENYITRAEKALREGELPLADEYLYYAEVAMDTGVEPDVGEHPVSKEDPVVEFAHSMKAMYDLLEDMKNATTREILNAMKNKGILNMKRVPKPRDKEIIAALHAWGRLKRPWNINKGAQACQDLNLLLEYLGFQKPATKLKEKDKQAVYFLATMSAASLSPLADFGSLRNNHYDVILFFGRPHVEVIGQILEQYGVQNRCPIILFMGRMTARQRNEWSQYCHANSLVAMLIDEILLYYLASQREARIRAAVSCGVAWGYAMPYRPSGVIPPEIFKGRRLMVDDLGKETGTCIVYGGRQYGKSVLLRMVEHKFHNPQQDSYVFYEDIKNIGNPQTKYKAEEIWQRLRERLIAADILPWNADKNPGSLLERIRKVFARKDTMKVLVLFDEADYFLAADAKSEFLEVTRLRSIMEDTRQRFKVVFCGLQSVQRYLSKPNHPFAQLMTNPLVVGPLEPESARALIVEPMAAIGFDFSGEEADKAILRILCYTNYHPAQIQHFCSELIKLIRHRKHEPPYHITLGDVEAVYRREDVRGFMRERFNWTLDLDPCYVTIVYAMVLEQLQDQDGYRREFTAPQLLEMARWWWEEGFRNVTLEDGRSLLEELVGLGVLVKRASGTYRIKNGNIVRALGSEQEIEDRLEQILESAPPMDNNNVRSLRFRLNDGQRSPLTVKQVGELTDLKSGVGLVFGSEAVGIDNVIASLRQIMDIKDDQGGEACVIRELPPEYATIGQITAYIEKVIKRKRKARHIIYCRADDLFSMGLSVAEVVRVVTRLLRKTRRKVRFIILFAAMATYHWLSDPAQEGVKVEEEADV